MKTHVIIGDVKTDVYRAYLQTTGDAVVDIPSPSDGVNPDEIFDLGFICTEDVIASIKLLAPHCKVLVTPKLETFAHWLAMHYQYPGCQFVMAKPNLYILQVELLRNIRLMRDIITSIEISWEDSIGLLHIAHVVAGPLNTPTIYGNTMRFENFGIKIDCRETQFNEVRIIFADGSTMSHQLNMKNQSNLAEHKMIQDLFKLIKFNPGEYHKHFMLDQFVHKLLE